MNLDKDVAQRFRLTDFATERSVTISTTRAIWGLLGFYGGSLVMMALARVLPSVLTTPFIVLSLSFIPGALLLVALGEEELVVDATHLLYAFGASLVILMFVGALVNILFPFVGIVRPLMPFPLAISITAAVKLLAIGARWRTPKGTVSVRIPPLWSPTPLAFLLLPLLSIIGVTLLNATNINVLLVVVLLAISAVPLVAVWRLQEQWYSLAIWTTSLAILYHKSLWKYAGFGGRPHGIAAWEAGRWSPGVTTLEPYSTELVQNGVLFPLFARLADLFILTQYEVVNPFFVSFIPLALYVTFRQYVRADIAFLGAALFVFVHPFYLQYPTAGRAATPVLFLALFGVVLSNESLPSASRAALTVAFLIGLVVTHYATSYYVAAAFLVAIVLLYVLRGIERLSTRTRRERSASDGGTTASDKTVTAGGFTIFTLTTVSFFVTAALGWYLYTRGGWKFDLLPKHVYENFVGLVRGSSEVGRTTARIQENYDSVSIETSKYIYILIAVLTAVGIAHVYYRRFSAADRSFDDHYVAIAAALFGVFGTTVLFRNWGGGRPMMITFSFTSVFAVLGAVWVANGAPRLSFDSVDRLPVDKVLRTNEMRGPRDFSTGPYLFAILLMVFLWLNTGVAAAMVLDESAPSNVPAQPQLATHDSPQSQVLVHRETDVATHLWMVDHLDSQHEVYGDTYAARQFDWYRPEIAARTSSVGGGYTSATKPDVFDTESQRTGSEPGYVLIMGHNVVLESVWLGNPTPKEPIETLSLDDRNRIYTTGESHVYFYSESQETPTETVGDD